MRVLLHICCGPCAIMPIRKLLLAGHEVAGLFYNPNVHPLAEYLRRRESTQKIAVAHDIALFFPANGPEPETKEYDVANWCHAALNHAEGRCVYCRVSRFAVAATTARHLGFDAFTSSLLYSRHQDHAGMRTAGEEAATTQNIPFLYQDFRPFWQEGITASKELNIYRQQYCGCVFSEETRYQKDLTNILERGNV